jgi:hypothetical protein
LRGTKIEAYSRSSVPNPSSEEKKTWNSVPWTKNRRKFSKFRSEPFRGREKQLGIPFRVEQNAAGYKKTGLGELRRRNFDCTVIIYSSLRTVKKIFNHVHLSKAPIKHSKSATVLRNSNWAEDPVYFSLGYCQVPKGTLA